MRNFRIRTCSSNARAASVPPSEGPEEAAEGSPFTETLGIQSDRRGSRDSRARPSNAADHRRGSDGQHIVSCPVARHLEPIGEARARPFGFSPRPTGDRRGSATGRVADLRQSRDERRGCAGSGHSIEASPSSPCCRRRRIVGRARLYLWRSRRHASFWKDM